MRSLCWFLAVVVILLAVSAADARLFRRVRQQCATAPTTAAQCQPAATAAPVARPAAQVTVPFPANLFRQSCSGSDCPAK